MSEVMNNDPIVDQDEFVQLVKRCTKRDNLTLSNVSIDQKFYDMLPQLCKNITELVINKSNENDINCDFVIKFRHLKRFEINQKVPCQIMDHLCSNNEDFEEICFKYNEHEAAIIVFDRSDYPGRERDIDFFPVGLSIGKYTPRFDDLDELLGFLKNILKY